jgi:hypothetical protein
LDNVLELALEGARRLLWWRLARERGVELLLHLEGHVRVVRRDGAWAGVLERLFGEGDDGHAILDLGVVVEIRPGRQEGAFDRPEPLLLGSGEELYELPGGVRVLGAGTDIQRLVPNRAVARFPSADGSSETPT